jgi:hypothetical protein
MFVGDFLIRPESLIEVPRRQLFIRVHNETLSVVAMRVSN